ncbi:hypothetical protein PybrP1_010731 [[Pythium] brassicae (nom. inval.)]|nr:hypothetical protein PybrP1_010731 [[Pythium] brassicae (nom. inval.)]
MQWRQDGAVMQQRQAAPEAVADYLSELQLPHRAAHLQTLAEDIQHGSDNGTEILQTTPFTRRGWTAEQLVQRSRWRARSATAASSLSSSNMA